MGADRSGLARSPANELQPRHSSPATPVLAPANQLTPVMAPATSMMAPTTLASALRTRVVAPSGDTENRTAESDDDPEAPAQYEILDFDDKPGHADMGLLDIGHDEQATNIAEQLGAVVLQGQRPRLGGKRGHRSRQHQVLEVYSLPRITKKTQECAQHTSAKDWRWISQ